MSTPNGPTVCAVMVTFHPAPGFADTVRAIRRQVARIVVCDNGSGDATQRILDSLEAEGVSVVRNGRNIGIAAAQNRGIAQALENGFDYVALFDDDSRPADGMIAAMLARAEPSIAILAPRIWDRGIGRLLHHLTPDGRWRYRHVACPQGGVLDDALAPIASGSLISARALRAVGLMREDFFIDYVDFEFALRARKAGWGVRIVGAAVLDHRLGEARRHRLLGHVVLTFNHSPARRFTIARNRIRVLALYGRDFPPFLIGEAIEILYDTFVRLAFEEQRAAKFAMTIRGLFAGVGAAWRDRGGAPAARS